MQLTNNLNLPQPIVDAIANDSYSQGKSKISITSLIDPPQKVALQREHQDDIVEDASDMIYALLGKSIHEILDRESHNSGFENHVYTEERLYGEFFGWTVSGQFDRLCDNVLQDYKIASVWEAIHGVKKDRIQQLNCYAHLIRENYIKQHWPEKLEIVYIFRDWQKSKAKFDPNYPQHQVQIIDIPIWPPAEALCFINNRVRLHQEAQKGVKMLCTDEERWKDPTKWAVKKQGGKRAIKLYENYEEAVAHVDQDKGLDLMLEERPSIARRCEDYCSVALFCPQFQNENQMEAA
mgnify:CR=1 FL=1